MYISVYFLHMRKMRSTFELHNPTTMLTDAVQVVGIGIFRLQIPISFTVLQIYICYARSDSTFHLDLEF